VKTSGAEWRKGRRVRRAWLTPTVWGFSVASLFSDFGHELVTALIPGFLTGLGAPPVALGLVEGISNLGQSLAGLAGGRLADQSRRRVGWVAAGYAATGLKALLALVFWWPWVVVIRTLAWVGRGSRGPIRNTLIAEDVAPDQRGRAYGFREAWDTAGAVLGPLAAALLATHIGVRPLIAWSAIPGALGLAAVWLLVRDHPHRAVTEGPTLPLPPSYRQARNAAVLFQVGWIAPTLFILRVERAHPIHGVTLAIALYVVHNLTYALAAYPAGRWTDKWGASALMKLTGVVAVVVLVGFAVPSRSIALWAVLFAAAGVVTALWETAQKPWILNALHGAPAGEGFGQFSAGLGLGQWAGNLLVTGAWTLVGPLWAFVLAAFLAALGTARVWAVDVSL
jgi:hypothetical protein